MDKGRRCAEKEEEIAKKNAEKPSVWSSFFVSVRNFRLLKWPKNDNRKDDESKTFNINVLISLSESLVVVVVAFFGGL